jgi:hypothetical protein
MFIRTIIVLCFLVFPTYAVTKVAVAQEDGVGPDIEGPHEGLIVAPVEMTEDMSEMPNEVPIREEPIEVPLQEVPLPGGMPPLRGDESRAEPLSLEESVLEDDPDIPPEFSMPDPNFDGVRFGDSGAGFIPPDTNGDVGPDHYVQTVNSSIAIFDKEGSPLAGPMPINTLFTPLGGPCATGDVIDPIVNHDPLADRWIVMGFPFASPICVAVSRTNDPVTGGWFLYDFDVTAFGFPDYPKLGVWPDAYYLTTQRGFPGGGLDVYALDRENMLNGNPAALVHFFVAPPSLFLLPADLDGPPPRPGVPAPFVRHVDGDLWGGADRLEVFEFSVDFQDPLSSTFDFVAGCRPIPSVRYSAAMFFLGTARSNRMEFGSRHCQHG